MVSDKAKACPKCGTPVAQGQPRQPQQGEPSRPQAQENAGNMIFCPHCRLKVSAATVTCPRCRMPIKGAPAPAGSRQPVSSPQAGNNLIACRQCGHQISAKALNCPKCGALTLNGEAQEKERLEKERRQQEERRQLEQKRQAENAERLYQTAVTSLNNGNYTLAREQVNTLLSQDPDNERYHRLKTALEKAFKKRVEDLCATISTCLASGRLDDAQDDMGTLIAMNPDKSSYKDLKERLDNALWQRQQQQKKTARRRTAIIGSIAAAIVVAALGAGGYYYHIQSTAQQEQELWNAIEQGKEMADIEDYLNRYPDGDHAAQAQELKSQFQEMADQWAKVEAAADPDQLQKFISKYPDSPYRDKAVAAIDKILWQKATAENTATAYNRYLTQCPAGSHVDEAKQWIQQQAKQQADMQEKLKLTPGESSMVTSRIRSFFNAMAAGNSAGMTSLVATPMASFLGKSNATSSDVAAYMRRVHSGDVYSVSVSMGNVNVKKTLGNNGSPVYTATFGFDQRLGREDTSQETFAHYNGIATLNASGMITSIGLNKTSHY